MDEAIRKVDHIIERKGECVIGGIMEQFLRCKTEPLVDELKARGYVVRDRPRGGYVVYPKRKKLTQPRMIIEVI